MSLVEAHFGQTDPATTLQLSQAAPTLLAKTAPANALSPLSFVTSSDTPETWLDLEKLVVACLQAGDDKNAHLALERLTQRFGSENERVMGLRGLYQEALAKNMQDLQKVVNGYNKILIDNPMNIPIHKRRIALTRSLNQEEDAAIALVDFLGSFPSDTEAWSELSDVYYSQGLAAQAVFCLEEALLGAPNAWHLHARLGELEYMAGTFEGESQENRRKFLSSSTRRFARSVELCDDYLRGYYGLAMATKKLRDVQSNTKAVDSGSVSQETAQELHADAIRKLGQIVASQPDVLRADIVAAQQLLDTTKS